MIAHRLSFVDGKEYPALADVRNLKSITKEAKDYLAKDDGVKGMVALGILVGNFVTAMIANLFVNFSRPAVRTRVFSNKAEAIRWLSKFVKDGKQEVVTKSTLL